MMSQMRGDATVSPMLQKELDERIAQSGDMHAVRQELEEKLHDLETRKEKEGGTVQVEIALVLEEIKYLDQKLQDAGRAVVTKRPGLMERVRHFLSRQAKTAS
jgi:hypothetical protein